MVNYILILVSASELKGLNVYKRLRYAQNSQNINDTVP